MKVCIAKK